MAAPSPAPTPTTKWHSNTYESLSPARAELSAKGKSVLVTGGGTGIGAETARSFAAAGASRIALLGRREQPLLDTKAAIEREFPGVEVLAAPADVTQKGEVDAAFARFLDGRGPLHVVISNAGVTGSIESVRDVDPDRLIDAVTQNLKGALHVAQAFLRYAADDAVVVNVSSSAAHLDYGGVFSAYSTAKMAVVRLWDSLGSANPELSVFHIQPGVVDTDMNREVGGIKAVGYEDHVSLPATFMAWLASPEARFLKGKFLWANWDVDELKARRDELESSTLLKITLGGWPFGRGDWKARWGD
ncbi:hypothetical protein C7999DRAFT_27364 [Corynascus novoguineensis]|uniref:Ketoreductase domain-containing protein n=1 Tax=Corynascus novoguineensis TaxID=1126955 RepID=A0AAN7HPB1_9PEZI|nr:hypothetical protein C7999DRAFT_27364 [Corynascus novoguineensis]